MKGPSENSTPDHTAMASTKADLRVLKSNSTATVQELQEFLRELRGKSPQEMLGVVASSQLIRATILSVVLVTGAIFALTAIPYFFGDEPAPEPIATVTPAAAVPAAPVATSKVASDETPGPLSPLGVNEALPAAPNSNPLEDKAENFLQDLE
jgi:hypothetical protein